MVTNRQTAVSSLDAIVTQMMEWLTETLGDSAEFMLPELATMYLEDVPIMLQEMRDATKNQDVVQLKNSAHRIKGSSSSMGLHTFSNLCQEVETAARTNKLDDINEMLFHIQAEYEQVKQVLQQYAA